MGRDTNGVALIGRILADVAAGEPRTAAELAGRLGAARTTTFEVLKQLEAAGFIDRDAQGLVSVGHAGADLGFAAFGFKQGTAAEALLAVLRDDLDADVELVVMHGNTETVLVKRCAALHPTPEIGPRVRAETLDEPVSTSGPFDAVLRLSLRPGMAISDRAGVRQNLKRMARALSQPMARDIGEER